MSERLVIEPNCKFAILVVNLVRVDVPENLVLQDGTRVLRAWPLAVNSPWKEWLGSNTLGKLQSCNLFLLRTATTGWPMGQLNVSGDAISTRLQAEVGRLFAMLRLLGTIEYDEAFVLSGYVENGDPVCRHFGRTERFQITRGYLPWVIREADLRTAVQLCQAYSVLPGFPGSKGWRFGRGCAALKAALEQFYASDRLHGFVRSLEALILPAPGRTEKDFVSRCALIAGPKAAEAAVRAVMLEAYRMRCDIEHMHDWDRSLERYAPADREKIALWRTRQMEALACAAYRAIILDPRLEIHFRDDASIAAFWKKSDDEIRAAFGDISDITQLKIVNNWEQFGRAAASEWPPELFEHLRPKARSA